MKDSIEELRKDIEKLYDLVFYHRVVEQAQIGVLRSWAAHTAQSLGRDPTDEADAILESVRMAIDSKMNELEDVDSAMAARILSHNPNIRNLDDLLSAS